jgi:hypothetical protein
MFFSIIGIVGVAARPNFLFVKSESGNHGNAGGYLLASVTDKGIHKTAVPFSEAQKELTFGPAGVAGVSEKDDHDAVVTWTNGQMSRLHVKQSIEWISFSQNYEYLIVTHRGAETNRAPASDIYRIEKYSLQKVFSSEDNAFHIANGVCFLTKQGPKPMRTSVTAVLARNTQHNGVSKDVQSLYLAQTKYWCSDPYRNFQAWAFGHRMVFPYPSISISPDGKFWFGSEMRLFVDEGMDNSRYFAGDVMLNQSGIACQWKYNVNSLRGAYFVDKDTFRFMRSDRFLFGHITMRLYEAGVYDLCLRSNALVKVKVPGMSSSDLQAFELIAPN